jgi:DnaJ-class molecular chaperone
MSDEMEFEDPITCTECGGLGEDEDGEPCTECDGEGEIAP